MQLFKIRKYCKKFNKMIKNYAFLIKKEVIFNKNLKNNNSIKMGNLTYVI